MLKEYATISLIALKVNKSVYIAWSGQRRNITLYNFFLHVLIHALKRFLIDVLIDFINYGMRF